MGQSLSDSGQYYGSDDSESPGAPKSSDWRTPPLWGLRESAPYLHDGRAATIAEAIEAHGGEAWQSAHKFTALSIEEKFRLVSFLKTLTAPAGPGALARRSDEARDAWRLDLATSVSAVLERDRQQAEEHAQADARVERKRVADQERRTEGQLHIARMTELNGNTAAALGLYRELIRRYPDSQSAKEARGRIYALLK
jgi:hypothetical protein